MKVVTAIFLIAFLASQGCVTYGDERLNGRWLITAEITNAKFVKKNGSGFSSSSYAVQLRHVEVIQGQEGLPAALDVTMDANHIEGAKNIFAIIEFVDGAPRVRYWEQVIPMACIPENLVIPGYESLYYREEWNAPNQRCTLIDGPKPLDSD